MIEQLEKVNDVAIVPEHRCRRYREKMICIAGLIDAPEEALKAALADLQEDYEFLKSQRFRFRFEKLPSFYLFRMEFLQLVGRELHGRGDEDGWLK